MAVKKGSEHAMIAALAAGSSVTKAADAGGITRKTLSKRLNDDSNLILQIRNARKRLLDQTLGKLLAKNSALVSELLTISLEDDDSRVRLNGIARSLNLSLRLAEAVDIEERVAEIERRLDAGGLHG